MNYTTAHLYCSPLCIDGSYTVDFSSKSARADWFAQYRKFIVSECYYIRKDEIIKVPYNADVLDKNGINYVSYQNDSGTTIFAFVTEIEYVAESVSILHLKTDSFVTYQFDISRNQAFIEREHVSDDSRGANLLPEPVGIVDYTKNYILERFYSTDVDNFSNQWYIGIIIGHLNISEDDPNEDAKNSINTGSLHQSGGTPVGGNLFAVEYDDFNICIKCMTALNAEIVCAFPLVKDFVNKVEGSVGTINFGDDSFQIFQPLYHAENVNAIPSAEPWATPARNKKLCTFPYNYLVGTNECGTEQVYKIEKTGYSPSFQIGYTIAPTPSFLLVPNYYNGIYKDMTKAVTNTNIPNVPWNTNAYDLFFAQNANALVFQQISEYADTVMGMFGDLRSNESRISSRMKQDKMDNKSTSRSMGSALTTGYRVGMAHEERQAQYNDLKGLGSSVHNIPSSNVLGFWGKLGVGLYQKFVIESEKERIDQFFDRYGYNVSKTATIQWNSRPHYNYIKTSGANIGGTIPQKNKNEINTLLDNGLTVWHMSGGGVYGVFDGNNAP